MFLVRSTLPAAAAGPVAEPGSLAAAELFARFHLAQKAPDPVHLFVVCRAELLEAGNEFPGWFAALCGLLLDLIKKAIQFHVDLKKRICCCNR